jgi:ATP-dependent helicase HrpB
LGDLLVFLPGVGEIKRVMQRLHQVFSQESAVPLISPLYGDLPKQEQDRALLPDPDGRRRIVLTTSIAETSLTIEGVNTVVDCGWSRLPVYLPGAGLSRLETLPISRAAADQRAGRAGRLGPGSCYRLWPESYHHRLPAYHGAEILQADLSQLVLELARWGVQDPAQLAWPDPPPTASYQQARELLLRLGALDEEGRLTETGKKISQLPLHPRLSHMLVHATGADRERVCDLAALLSERDILPGRNEAGSTVDMELRLRLLQQWRQDRADKNRRRGGEANALRQIDRLSRDWQRRLNKLTPVRQKSDYSVAQYLALAYPDRIAQRTAHARFRLVSGRAVRLFEDDPLSGEAYLVAAQLDAGRKEGRVRMAVAINESEIRQLPDLALTCVDSVAWDSSAERVEMLSKESIGAVVLQERRLQDADGERIAAAMLSGIEQMGLKVLPWTRSLSQWRERVNWLRQVLPDEGLPDLSDKWLLANLSDWLSPWLEGVSRKSQLQQLDLTAILQALLSWQQMQLVEEEAPSHIRVPSGSKIALKYQAGESPVLAVRLQEMFGLAETPRVGRGRVPLMLHLLSPAQRPMQITDDLGGFWRRTYGDVKRELKGRYPKHHWPDDPLSAAPTARAKSRR